MPAQGAQRPALFGRQYARDVIHHTERSQSVTFGCYQRGAGIETDIPVIYHQRVVRKARVRLRIVHFENFILMQNRVRAKGDIPWRLRSGHPDIGFEPLPRSVHEGNQFGFLPRRACVPLCHGRKRPRTPDPR